MEFKADGMKLHWSSLHPEVRVVLGELDEVLDDWKLPTFTVTETFRSFAQQEELYWKEFLRHALPEPEARKRARAKFSWHQCGCAADFRSSKTWKPEEWQRVFGWLVGRCPTAQWERLKHNAGTGTHFHIAYRDMEWKKRWAALQGGFS